ncbi:MAG: hypothetical protein ACJAR9_000426 [Celeribacter sp.]
MFENPPSRSVLAGFSMPLFTFIAQGLLPESLASHIVI